MKTTHNLDFEVAPYEQLIDDGYHWLKFRVGTCQGLWTSTDTDYIILAIENTQKGNGHLDDVLEWFEHSCKRDKKDFKILEFMLNKRFKKHLIDKRGFKSFGLDNVIKCFV